jgi:hypothetical protein
MVFLNYEFFFAERAPENLVDIIEMNWKVDTEHPACHQLEILASSLFFIRVPSQWDLTTCSKLLYSC